VNEILFGPRICGFSRSFTQGFSLSFTHPWVLLLSFYQFSSFIAITNAYLLERGEHQLPIEGPKPERGRSQGRGARYERSAARRA
jgi:hypothetical protein